MRQPSASENLLRARRREIVHHLRSEKSGRPAVENAFDFHRVIGIIATMADTTTLSKPEAVAALCSTLDPAHQTSLLEFAQFLKSQEAQAALGVVDEEDEAAWEREFADPAKVASFARWADENLAREKPHPVDPRRL
jgi:hypothetical protein